MPGDEEEGPYLPVMPPGGASAPHTERVCTARLASSELGQSLQLFDALQIYALYIGLSGHVS